MTGNQQSRGTIALLMVVAAAIVVALFGVLHWDRKDARPALTSESAAPGQSPAPAQPGEQRQAAIAPAPQAAQPEAGPEKGAPAPAVKSGPAEPTPPSFDVVRIEPNGESVIAGRGAPGATIELLRDGQVHARVAADASGLFAFVPPVLPAGSHQVSLQSIAPDGTRQRSRETVSIVISEGRNARPLVALTSPDRPTVLLSNPEPPEAAEPKPAEVKSAGAPPPARGPLQPGAAGAPNAATSGALPGPGTGTPSGQAAARPEVKIVTVEAEEGGRLFVSGQGAPGATVRLYLNETFIAPGGVGGDGRVSFAIGRGVKPGDYRVRLDDVDPVSGSVKSRAEVAFNVPKPLLVPSPPAVVPPVTNPPALSAGADSKAAPVVSAPAGAPVREGAAAGGGAQVASALPGGREVSPSSVLIPDINTTIISRGDNLWRLSQRIYGRGVRYTVIYGANRTQIRNPDLIYPGQVFVVPAEAAKAN